MSAVPGPGELLARIPSLAGRRVVVLGDPVLDVYLYGTTHRISREAPVLIVREDARESRLGGAANAAANLAALGGTVRFVGAAGDDQGAAELSRLCAGYGIDTRELLRVPERHTVTKTRIMAGGVHTTKQQMLRIDRENDQGPQAGVRDRLTHAAERALADADALVISEYGEGFLTELYSEIARRARAAGRIVVVDSRFSLSRYHGVTAVTPNAPEAEAATGKNLERAGDAARGAEELRARMDLEAVVLTRGREGMAVAERGSPTALISAHGAREAVDVTGAGDTVTATFTLALAAGATVLEAAALANCAASIAVQTIGAATVSPDELRLAVQQLDPAAIQRFEEPR